MLRRKGARVKRFGWTKEEAKGLIIRGKPDYKEISLTRDGVRVTNRGETPR